jgi:hypothetical protein
MKSTELSREEQIMARFRVFVMLLVAALSLGWCAAAQARLAYTPIPFNYNSGGYISGNQSLGGIPFNIPIAPENSLWTTNTGESGTITLNIPLHVYGVSEVHTLINTVWGYSGQTHTWLTFTGSGGASYTIGLVNGSDIRDYYNGSYANSINGTTTVNVWSIGPYRLDKQKITLPGAFAGQYLTNILIEDDGGTNYHRTLLSGVTVGNNPVPLTGILPLLLYSD